MHAFPPDGFSSVSKVTTFPTDLLYLVTEIALSSKQPLFRAQTFHSYSPVVGYMS
ncbi:hypothetical protein HYDPIDRAFT_117466 [Hydnomerulius pinastri MD-312]|uniref:Unplaced genomic scaffold scaffold_41, whole genome shotgun sequence n=1 Tax=Hydnomerulius pinastri MD-312 TaxID=994086 RepID=A0A0C9VR39_9AGAM|nr:hypothetical protein HYDPIDRAFT_117466 [Hydnomerulius pinastri MD-312]